ncbi:MAG: hypothetical protein AB1499_07880 [Nitrospirota bacterium]
MLYSYPKFDGYDLGFLRVGGPGLGNNLFPWARSLVASNRYNLVPLAPTWRQFKIGPFIRNEKDKRLYYGLFKTAPGHICGWRKVFALTRLSAVDEQSLYEGAIPDDGSDKVVIFKGMDSYFGNILRNHAYVKQELLRITREPHKKSLGFDFSGSISVHVRLTDFALSSQQIPISWYISIVKRIRAAVESDAPVYVFTDGKDKEIAPLLNMPNSRKLAFGSSIGDLIALSRAHILVTSASTFSAWASYLGRMPVIWNKGKMVQNLYYENDFLEIQVDEGEAFPAPFNAAIRYQFRHDADHEPIKV